MRRIKILMILSGLLIGMAACTGAPPTPTTTPVPPTPTIPTNTPYIRPTLPPTFTPTFTPSVTFTPTATHTPSITPSPTLIPETVLCRTFNGGFSLPNGTTYTPTDILLLNKATGGLPVGILFELDGPEFEETEQFDITNVVGSVQMNLDGLESGRYDWMLSLFDNEREGMCAIEGFFLVESTDNASDALAADVDNGTPTPRFTRAPKNLDSTPMPTTTKTTVQVSGRMMAPSTAVPTQTAEPERSPEMTDTVEGTPEVD